MSWRKRRDMVRDLAEGLVKAGALQFGPSTLPDGKESSYFINLRGVASYPGLYRLAVDAVGEVVSKKAGKADALCGVPMVGLTMASPVAIALGKPLAYLRPSGTRGEKAVEGDLRPDWNVVVIDDLAETGKTILSSARALELEGCEVNKAVVLIDRLEGAREKLSRSGIALHAFTDILELADALFAMELISERNLKSITKSVGGRQ
jgi:orotate phosphoribosyltransferase